jgi:hypothetical protein
MALNKRVRAAHAGGVAAVPVAVVENPVRGRLVEDGVAAAAGAASDCVQRSSQLLRGRLARLRRIGQGVLILLPYHQLPSHPGHQRRGPAVRTGHTACIGPLFAGIPFHLWRRRRHKMFATMVSVLLGRAG